VGAVRSGQPLQAVLRPREDVSTTALELL